MTEKPTPYFRKDRTEALADGIFATVMTILVLSLVVPTITGANASGSLQATLSGLLPDLIVYVFTFVYLGMLWIGHQNALSHITRIDLRILWLNILLLLGVAVIPFSTALLGRYPLEPLANITYGINGVVVSSLYNVLWFYPRRINLAHDEPNPEMVAKRSRTLIVGPIVFTLAILFAFVSTYISFALIVFVAAYFTVFAGKSIH